MKHCIIVKWNEKVTDKDLFYNRTCEAFSGVLELDGVSGLKVYRTCSGRANRADLMVEIECTEAGLLVYDASDLHRAWKEDFGEYIASKMIFDYE